MADRHWYCWVRGPLGLVLVFWNGAGVTRVVADVGGEVTDEEVRALYSPTNGPSLEQGAEPPADVAAALRHGRSDEVALDLRGVTDFEASVLRVVATIPRGEVRTYAWVAERVGRPGAARAVGQALRRNPFPVLVPCHRVVRSDGSLGGYALGVTTKQALLAAEGRISR